MESLQLAGRAALVTGSTQGIGHGIASSLAEAGANLVYHGLQAADMGGAPCIALDLLQPGAPAELVEKSFEAAPGLDILVCNAGGFFDVPFLEMEPEKWDRTYALNVRAPYFIVQAFARRLVQEKRGGSVILISSTNGSMAEPDSTAYDSSKGALVMLTRTLALNLAAYNIRVNGLAPGLIRTPLTETWLGRETAMRLHYEKNIPLGRVGLPRDLGGAAVLLASSASDYITGQTITVDGGLTVSQIGPL